MRQISEHEVPAARARRPWPQWANGCWHLAEDGTDFHEYEGRHSFIMSGRIWAKRHGYKMQTRLEGKNVFFRFEPVG